MYASTRKDNLQRLLNFTQQYVKQGDYNPGVFGSTGQEEGCLLHHAYHNDPTNTVLPPELSNIFYDSIVNHREPSDLFAYDNTAFRSILEYAYFKGAAEWFKHPPARLRDCMKRLDSEIRKCDALLNNSNEATPETPAESVTVVKDGVTFKVTTNPDGKATIAAEGVTLSQLLTFLNVKHG